MFLSLFLKFGPDKKCTSSLILKWLNLISDLKGMMWVSYFTLFFRLSLTPYSFSYLCKFHKHIIKLTGLTPSLNTQRWRWATHPHQVRRKAPPPTPSSSAENVIGGKKRAAGGVCQAKKSNVLTNLILLDVCRKRRLMNCVHSDMMHHLYE